MSTFTLPSTAAIERGDRFRPSRFSRLFWHLTALRSALEGFTQRHLAGAGVETLIDFGCGNAPYRPLIEPLVGGYRGADLAGSQHAELEISFEGRLLVADGTADCVLSTQVLEHVGDPRQYLSEANRVLLPGGLLLLSTHGVWKYHPDPTDYWRWTRDGLRRVIEDAGFSVAEMLGVMGPSATALQLLQDAVLPAAPSVLRPAICGAMQTAMQAADALTSEAARDRDACVYLVAARSRS